MRPGVWSYDGFLRPGTSLQDVLDRDAQTLAGLGMDAEWIGARLQELLSAGRESDWRRQARVGDYTVELRRERGFITCPWAPDQFEHCRMGQSGRPTANQFRIVHRGSRRILEGYELSAHLIGEHAFFGGPGTPFRIEPEVAATVLAGKQAPGGGEGR